MLDQLAPLQFAFAGCELIFLAIFAYLYKREKQRHLALWSVGMGADTIARVVFTLHPPGPAEPLSLLISNVLLITMVTLLLLGVHDLLSRPVHRGWLAAAFLSLIAPAGLVPLGMDFRMVMALPMLVVAVFFLRAGWLLLKGAAGGMGRLFGGGGMMALGLHVFTYPLVASDPALLVIGTGVGGVLWVGTLSGLVLVHFDRALARREASDVAYRELVEHAIVGIYQTNDAGRFVSANPTLVEMLGYDTLEEVLALDLARDVYMDPEARSRFMAANSGASEVVDVEHVWKKRDGTPLYVNLSARRVLGPSGETLHYEGFARDVTAARLLKDRLLQAEKLEAVGRLAGGVAHDFNNYLTVIRGNSALLRDAPVDEAGEIIDDMEEATIRAAALTDQLLAFSRRSPQRLDVMDLSEVVRSSMGMLPPLLGEQLQLALELAPEAVIRADRNQLQHALLNLCVNARDAMPEGGTLSIRTSASAEEVSLSVSDAGHGIPEADLAHIFEPFFTTKGPGEGTGLGLAQVYGVVTQAGGQIDVTNNDEKGATFSLRFPRCHERPPEETARSPAARGGRRARLLLVEDEPALRRLLALTLTRAGHEVQQAEDSAAALSLMERNEPLDAMITDLTMPGMDGVALAAQIRISRPDLPVLFMSGYPDRVAEASSLSGERTAFLPKPFAIAAFQAALTQLLREAA